MVSLEEIKEAALSSQHWVLGSSGDNDTPNLQVEGSWNDLVLSLVFGVGSLYGCVSQGSGGNPKGAGECRLLMGFVLSSKSIRGLMLKVASC